MEWIWAILVDLVICLDKEGLVVVAMDTEGFKGDSQEETFILDKVNRNRNFFDIMFFLFLSN
jgi:hypothetical protein